LNNLTVGDVQLKFTATGLDATITLRGVEAGDRIDITVRVTDSSVRIDAERRERGGDGDDDDRDERESGDFRCTETISSPLNRPVLVPSGQTCVVDASLNGNVTVHGTLILREGRRINGNVDLVSGTVDARPNSRISGNILSRAAIVLAAALVEGNVRYVSPGELEFASGQTIIRGNLEFDAPTNVSGGGNVTVFGNVRCNGHVVDDHTGMVVTTGQREGCPSTFNGQS
jgi:cytoskeletal protein CcmA (bactofilin family)